MGALAELEGLIRFGGLHVIRVWAALVMVPVFGSGATRRFQQLGLALLLGSLAAWTRIEAYEDPGADPVLLAVLAGKELLFGALLGWVIALIFESTKIAGALIATEMGLNMSALVDPTSGGQISLLSQLFQSMAIVLFFTAGGHELAFRALLASFEATGPGMLPEGVDLGRTVLGFSSLTIAAGIRLAAPVMLVMITVTVCVGILAKVAPQLHVLEASYPIRILASLLLLVMFLPGMVSSFDLILEELGIRLMDLAATAG